MLQLFKLSTSNKASNAIFRIVELSSDKALILSWLMGNKSYGWFLVFIYRSHALREAVK